ncbi:hypothetical protein [Kitasatospora sp. GAS1066B]|uniref:hypothetical protein n=1 Tax=Kitasatospora sp. GAS1066B TaxID=3156271 RepID=UPI003513246E
MTSAELEELLKPQHPSPAGATTPETLLDIGDADDMKRRDALGLLTITGALIVLPRSSVEPSASHTELDSTAAETLNSHLWKTFSLADSKQTVYPLVHRHLQVLARQLREARTEKERTQLCAWTGDPYQLAGEIFFDGNRYTDAAHCYLLAASAAKEAGNHDLWACAMTRHAFIELYERRFTVAAPILSAAARVAQHGDSRLSTRHWVAAVQAEAYAGLGDLDACNRALDRADEVHSLGSGIHNGGWLRFDGSRLAEDRGTCYLELGRPDLAEQALTAALRQALSPRRRGAVLASFAALGAERGDLDQVMQYGSAAIELASLTGSGFLAKRLEGLQTHLGPLMADGRVSNLHHQISALSRVARRNG